MTGAVSNCGLQLLSFFPSLFFFMYIWFHTLMFPFELTVQIPELQPKVCQKSTCRDLPEWLKNPLAKVGKVLLGGFKQVHLQITKRKLHCRLLNSDYFFFQKLT